jgi:hypothetical protein
MKVRNVTSLGERQSRFRVKNEATKHGVKFHPITYAMQAQMGSSGIAVLFL